MTAAPILEKLEALEHKGPDGRGWCSASCPNPSHVDKHYSFGWKDRGADGVEIKCQAGCSTDAVLAALDLPRSALFPPKTNGAAAPGRSSRRIVATYDYTDGAGALLYQAVRYEPKDFRQRRADGAWTMDGVRRVLYRLPELLASTRGIVVVEGEKDADRLAELGIVATCNVGGAGKWRAEYAEPLRGRTVVVIPDNDEPGRQHADDVARKLDGTADVRILELAELPEKGDVSDWIDAGHTAEELRALLLSAPVYSPGTADASGLRFYSPREVTAMTPERPDWIVGHGLLALGAITEVDGKIKAAGKTTFLLDMVRAVLDGADFLGEPTRRCRAIYVTEQSKQTFSVALRRAGLANRGSEMRVLYREDIGLTPWPKVVGACRQDGYDLVVFDTIGKLSGIKNENDAGEWSIAMTPIQDLAASGRAVPIARHDRKGGGEVGESGRGSSQASGDVDIILALRRPEGNQPSTRRVIETLSRYTETPDKLVVELAPEGYALLGTNEAVAASEAVSFVVAALGSEYQQKQTGLPEKVLVERGGQRSPSIARWAIQDAIAALLASNDIVRSGRGVRGDPYSYTPAGNVSAETQTYRTGEKQKRKHEPVNGVRDMSGMSVSEEMAEIFDSAS